MRTIQKDIITKILLSEKKYSAEMEKAEKKVQAYKEELHAKKNQTMDTLRDEWRTFERDITKKYEALEEEQKKLSRKRLLEQKQQLLEQKEKSMDTISDQLMKEVLSQYGNR